MLSRTTKVAFIIMLAGSLTGVIGLFLLLQGIEWFQLGFAMAGE